MARYLWSLLVAGVQRLVFVPKPASAQETTARRDSAIARHRSGQQIRTPDFAQGDAAWRTQIPAIDTLWVPGGSSTTGAIIGASLGVFFARG